MNALITGGAGFIGSHLAERLLRDGWRVTVLDDLSTGAFQNIAHLRHSSRFSYLIDTVFNAPLIQELVDCSDVVFHLAAAVGVRFIIESPVRTIETNVYGTEVVLKAVAKKKKRVFLASTSEVYGKSSALPFQEDSDLVLGSSCRDRWSYACSKLLDEFLGIAYWREKRVPVTILRLFNTVGPRQTGRYGMVLPTFVKQALLNSPITVYGTGQQSRCFGYVGDSVEAIARLANVDHAAGEIVNIGNNRETTVLQLAELVRAITGSISEIKHISYDEAYGVGFEDMQRRIPAVEKLERLTGYRMTTPLETVISLVAEEMRDKLANAVAARPWDGTVIGAAR